MHEFKTKSYGSVLGCIFISMQSNMGWHCLSVCLSACEHSVFFSNSAFINRHLEVNIKIVFKKTAVIFIHRVYENHNGKSFNRHGIIIWVS
jgi:hypothetical protein